MSRLIGCLSAVVVCVTLAACDEHAPAPAGTSSEASSTTAPVPKPDQSKIFFPGVLDTYGLDLSATDRDRLAELYALRQIDPCGFVDKPALLAEGRKDFSYSYSAIRSIGNGSALTPLGADGCKIVFPETPMALSLRVLPGENRINDAGFSPDTSRPGLTKRDAPICAFRVGLPLTALAGAPASMHDPVLEVLPVKASDGTGDLTDTSLCQLGQAVAGDIALRTRESGVPVHADRGSITGKLLTSDPCAAAVDLRATSFIWTEPSPEAQSPATWRHPGVCNFQFGRDGAGSGVSSAVVRYGLAEWSDKIFFDPRVGDTVPPNQIRSEQDGVELFDLSQQNYCLVAAKTNSVVEPTSVGTGIPEPSVLTPVVTVDIHTPDNTNCADIARQTAAAAAKRAL
ncbi:hypothetical protein [Mycobacteroides saopaulense]|uniref:hypothetical protein n=1 Tax=Mycobacteroides saopaulense TaxID=1578165 RepID=UPI000B4C9327|nr:hypothetical protein [Mycobacteroides saopaulense]